MRSCGARSRTSPACGPVRGKFAGLAQARDSGAMAPGHDRRQGRGDRRDSSRPAIPPGVERRRNVGCRRRLPELRWRQWPSIAAAAALGVVTAFALQGLQADVTAREPVANEVHAEVSALAARLPISLEEAQALHDEAAALTPAGVALDERAHATWLPRIGRLEAAAEEPGLPREIHAEIAATLAALTEVGLRKKAP